MTTIILGDSRLKGLHRIRGFQGRHIVLNVTSGAKLGDQKRFIKKERLQSIKGRKLFCVCLGINDIREDIGALNIDSQKRELTKVRQSITSIVQNIRKYHSNNTQIVIATIPPKDVKKAAEKYPSKSYVQAENVDRNVQLDFENFVEKINNTINSFNREESHVHLPLHRYVRIHRGSRRSKYYYDKFTDGLHPNEELKQKWACEILSVKEKLGF